MDLVILLRVLWRRKWYLIVIPILSVIATYFFTAGMKPEYRSTAQLATGFTTDNQIRITDERLNIREAEVNFNNLIQTMRSELVMSQLSYQLMLHDLKSETPFRTIDRGDEETIEFSPEERRKAIAVLEQKYDSLELLSSYDPFEAELAEYIAQYGYSPWQLKNDVEIQWLKGSDYVTVDFSSENPLLSAYVVNTLSEEYIKYDNRMRSGRSGQTVDFFEKQVKEKKQVLDEKSATLNNFRLSNNALNFEAQSSAQITQIAEYELRKEDILSDIQRLRISIASIDRKLNATAGAGSRTSINANIVRLRDKIDELNELYVRTGSKDEALQKSINDLTSQLQLELSKLSELNSATGKTREELLAEKEQYEIDLQVANANLQNVNNMIATLRGSVSGSASKEATIAALQKEVDKASEEYLRALDRFNTEKSKSLVSGSSVKLIIRGQPNGHPEMSKRYLLIGLAGVASFALCVFVIIFLEYFDVRIKTPLQFKRTVKMGLAGAVNSIEAKNLNLNELFTMESKDEQVELFKHFLRKVRYEIESSKARVILVTSTKPREGKTFLILHIAYLLSMIQKKILIIDTNFHHNSLTQILLRKAQNLRKLESGVFIRAEIGKGDEPNREMTEDEFTNSIIYPTGHRGIHIIGNNGGSESPSEIFAGKDFSKMISALSQNYDYILLEGASLNNFSDTKELVEYVDKVLPVFSAESVIKQFDWESIDYLKSLNGKLMGAVLNKVNTKDLNI